jgi:hypothetical protein
LRFDRGRAGRKNGFRLRRRCACAGERKSRAAAFPGGDLPEAPGGKKAALSRFATARNNYFPPPGKGPALHREAK